MIRVLVFGQPYWGSRIAQALDAGDGQMSATFVPQSRYANVIASPPRADRLVLLRAGFRVGGTTPRARLFDAFWALAIRRMSRAARSHYWLGTDVLSTVEEGARGTLRRGLVAASREDLHLADAAWLTDELGTVGISAVTAHVPQPYRAPSEVVPLPTEFRVLSYIPGDRFEFFGGNEIFEAARRLPDVPFDIVGAVGAVDRDPPPNVRLHGWVGDMAPFYGRASVVVRIPRHDGLGATVIEGLLNARHIVYTHEVPTAHRIWPATTEALLGVLESLKATHAAGHLEPNGLGRAYAIEEFEESRLVDHLRTLVRSRA